MPNLVTTTVYIGMGQKSALQQRREETGQPVAHFIREGIEAVLDRYGVPEQLKLSIFAADDEAEEAEKTDRSRPRLNNHLLREFPPALAEGDPAEILTVQQAAAAVGCSGSAISMAVRGGRLKASKESQTWSIRKGDLRHWFQTNHRRPPEKRVQTAFSVDGQRLDQLRQLSAEIDVRITDLVHEGIEIVLARPQGTKKRA